MAHKTKRNSLKRYKLKLIKNVTRLLKENIAESTPSGNYFYGNVSSLITDIYNNSNMSDSDYRKAFLNAGAKYLPEGNAKPKTQFFKSNINKYLRN